MTLCGSRRRAVSDWMPVKARLNPSEQCSHQGGGVAGDGQFCTATTLLSTYISVIGAVSDLGDSSCIRYMCFCKPGMTSGNAP